MEHLRLHAKMDIIAYFGGSTGIKYVHLPSISPLGNREKTLKKNPKLRDMIGSTRKSTNIQDFYPQESKQPNTECDDVGYSNSPVML